MGEVLQASAPESSPRDSGKWIGRIVIAVVLGEAIWGFLVAITKALVLPAIARFLGEDPQSPLYLGKGDFNVPALFISVLELCLAGIAAILVYSWTQRAAVPRPVRPARPAPAVAPRPVPVAAPPANPPPTSPPTDTAIQTKASVTSMPSAAPPAQPSKPAKPPAPAKLKRPKRVYYNIVGERVEEEDE